MPDSETATEPASSKQRTERLRKLGEIPPLDLSVDHMISMQEYAGRAVKELCKEMKSLDSVKEELVALLKLGEENAAHRAPSKLVLRVMEPLQDLIDSLKTTHAEGSAFISLLYASTKIRMDSGPYSERFGAKDRKEHPLRLSHRDLPKSHLWQPFDAWTESTEWVANSAKVSLGSARGILHMGQYDLFAAKEALEEMQNTAEPPNESAFQNVDALLKQLKIWTDAIDSTESAFLMFLCSFPAIKIRLNTMIRFFQPIEEQRC